MQIEVGNEINPLRRFESCNLQIIGRWNWYEYGKGRHLQFHGRIRYAVLHRPNLGGSFNGKTTDFDSVNMGSTPVPLAIGTPVCK